MNETTLRVDQPTCNHCVKKASAALSAVDGVHEVDVDLATHRATVWHAPTVAADALAQALTAAGYPASPIAD